MAEKTKATPAVSKFEDLLERANALIKNQRELVAFQNEMRDAFLLKSDDFKDKPDWIKELRDTTPFQAVITPVNILSAGAPAFTFEIPEGAMPQTKGPFANQAQAGVPGADLSALPAYLRPNIPEEPPELPPAPGQPQPKTPAEDLGEKLEKMMRLSLRASDVRQDMSLQRELALAGFLYSRPIVKTADLRMNALYEKKPEATDLLRGRPPFNYRACAPQGVFSERDAYGLSFVLHRYPRRVSEVRAMYPGKVANEFKGDQNRNCVWCEVWTRDEWCAWIQAVTDEITVDQTRDAEKFAMVQEPKANALGFIPFCMRSARGTRLFDDPTDQLFPMLYAGVKSQLFKRANLFLTVLSTLAFGQANQQWIHETDDMDAAQFELNFNEPTIHRVHKGDKVTPLLMPVNQPLVEVYKMIMEKEEEATIPRALSGQIPGGWGGTAASFLNMVIQTGKLEVVPVQESVSETYIQMAEQTLDYLKAYAQLPGRENAGLQFYAGGELFTLAPDELPSYMDIQCQLKASLPQDKKLLFDIAMQAHRELFLDLESAWEIAEIEDKNKVRERLDKEKQQRQQEQAQAQQPSGVTPPGSPSLQASGGGAVPVEQNPQAPELGAEAMAQATENMGQIP